MVHVVCLLSLFTICHLSVSLARAGTVEVFTDRSLFVDCLTWKVDFESLGNGTPLTLQEDHGYFNYGEEWRNQGVRFSTDGAYFGPAPTGVINWSSPILESAISLGGSGSNMFWHLGARLRIELPSALPAFGFATFHLSNRPFDTAYIYDSAGTLLRTVLIDESLLNGRVEGSAFGRNFDILYGFVGFHTPEDRIGRVDVLTHQTNFDDLHIGVIPEPMTAVLLSSALVVTLSAQRRRSRIAGL